MIKHLRPFLLLGTLAALLEVGASGAAAPATIAPYHEPPWLTQRGAPVTLAYALLPGSARGAVYARSDLQRSFTRLALVPGNYCPGDPADAAAFRRDKVCGSALLARVPRALTSGSKILYYALIHDPVSGHSLTIPAGGSRRPQRVWVVDRFQDVRLGTHRFGRFSAPKAVVARTGPKGVGLSCCADPPGGDGPSSFDVGKDGSIRMLDRLNHRLLVWRPGSPSAPARSVQLPAELAITDFALGRDGTIYARAADTSELGHGVKDHLYAFTASGKLRWRAQPTSGIATAQLQLGPDGALYAVQACGLGCAPFGGHLLWTPLTTPGGRPLSPAGRTKAASPFEPMPGGLRLVSEVSYSVARFALIDRAGDIVRAWRVRSTTRLSDLAGAPALVGGDPVVPFEISNGQRWEKLVVRLGPSGGKLVRVTLPDRPIVGEVSLFAPLRITPDGSLYQLRTSVTAGASVARYSVR